MATPYTNQGLIEGHINSLDLISLTDDNSTGNIDPVVLSDVITSTQMEIDGTLAPIYSVPFSGAYTPPFVVACNTIFACEALYDRRLVPDEKNPFKARADFFRKSLTKIGNGELELDAANPRSFNPGFVITQGSRLCGTTL